jgi:hypothetical protein
MLFYYFLGVWGVEYLYWVAMAVVSHNFLNIRGVRQVTFLEGNLITLAPDIVYSVRVFFFPNFLFVGVLVTIKFF